MIAHVQQAHPEIRVREVDLVEHPEVAIQYGVVSTPALAINGELVWEGVRSARALRQRLEAALQQRGRCQGELG